MPVRTSAEREERKALPKSVAPEAAPKAQKPKAPPMKSALEPITALEPKQSKKGEWTEPFILMHPDSTDDSPIDTTVLVNGEKIKIVTGRATVRSEKIRDALIRAGWHWVNERVNVQVDPIWAESLKRFKENQNG